MSEVVDAFVVKMSEHDSYLLFDDAVKLILTNLNDYKDKIIERFVQSYINDKKIPMITIGQILHANEDTIALSRYGDSVYFRPNFLCNKDFIVEDICVLFHELEHCNTNLINSKKRFFSNEQYSSYAFTDNDDFLYFSSSDELKSRQAEIFYADKFYEQALRIIYGESKYNTKENLEFLKSIKNQTTKKINEITKLYKLIYPYMRSTSTRIRYKLEAKKNFKNIKLFFNKQELFNNEQSYQRVRNYIYDKIFWLAGYISVYNDQKMLNKVLEFARRKHEGQFRKNGEEYITHPIQVATLVKLFKNSKNSEFLMAGALLHDVLEITTICQSAPPPFPSHIKIFTKAKKYEIKNLHSQAKVQVFTPLKTLKSEKFSSLDYF